MPLSLQVWEPLAYMMPLIYLIFKYLSRYIQSCSLIESPHYLTDLLDIILVYD